jgi:HdeA/HdeB family
MTRHVAILLIAAGLLAQRIHAADLNLATVSCAKYENEVLASTIPGYTADPIDTVMWLFGFSVAKSGERAMYGDSLSAFGFALDAECKTNPTTTLLEAATTVKSKRDNPMDLTRLDCATFETRHMSLAKTDPESAKTLTMWLFGYSVGLSGSHILAADSLAKFDSGLQDQCTKHPQDSLFDALSAPNPAVPASSAPNPAPRRSATKH